MYYCLQINPADRFSWAVYKRGSTKPQAKGLTITQAHRMVDTLNGTG